MKNAIKLLSLTMACVSMIFLSSCNKDEGSITPITIDFSGSAATVAENGGAQTVTILFSAEAPIDATFDVAISGTAEYGTDFTTSPDGATGTATVNVTAGDASATFTFTPIDNENVDGDKTAVFTITGAADGVELGTSLEYTITIDDEEGPSNVDFELAEETVSEDNGAVTVTLNFGTTTTAPGTVDVTMTGDDVSVVTTEPVATEGVFTVSSTSGVDAVTFTVTPVDDTEFAADRTVTFTLGNATNGVELGSTQQTYVLTITEDDARSIASVRSMDGEIVTIEGVVTTPDYGFGNGQYYVQDASGGINVFHDDIQNVSIGDLVRVTGEIGEFSGEININPGKGVETDVVIISSENDLPAATTITEADLLVDGAAQGTRVTITGVLITENQWPTEAISSGSGVNVDADANGTSFALRIDRGESFYDGSPTPGEPLTVTGVLATNGGNVQIFPFVDGDIVSGGTAPSLVINETLTDFGQVSNGSISAEQSYTITGSGLDNDVTITASTNFEVSTTAGTGFVSSITVSAADANAGATVFVRFNANSGLNLSYAGTIVHSSDDFVSQTIDVTGEEIGNASTSVLLEENFDYGTTEGAFVNDGAGIGASNWEAHSGAGNNPYNYQNSNLTFEGYGSIDVGGSVVSGTSEDINRNFAAMSSGTVYAAALVNVASAASTSGDYFMHFKTSDSFDYWTRVHVQDDGAGNLKFGVREKSGTTVYATENYAYGTTYIVVMTYNFTAGQAELHVMSAISATEPTPVAISSDDTNAPTSLDEVALRGDSDNPAITIDGIRVATDWAGALGIE